MTEIATLRGARIDGIKHPAIALARSLRSDAGRSNAGLYIIHGPVLLQRAVAAGVRVALALYTPRLPSGLDGDAVLAEINRANIPHALVSEGMMRAIVERAYLPEVIALVERRLTAPADLIITPTSFLVLANDLTNPSNLGMLVRTAYGADADALLLTSGTGDPFVWQVSTGSTGAIFRLPLVGGVQAADVARWRAQGLRTIAAIANAPHAYTELDYAGPICLMVGNEAHGLTADIAALADIRVRIPMAPHLDSLNVAVAAGILLFEARRARVGDEGMRR